ncbi:hypothetical protein BYT27DRAFT_7098334 [Phlegmacium glaucopus]|nr:hypothetical protein BYT27DRAFT_7098334 [Phlegmacium glaucopus]
MTPEPYLRFSSIILNSTSSLLLACLLVTLICLLERFLTFSLDKQWAPQALRLSSVYTALWRTGLYSIVTFLRLCYMFVAMTLHVGLVLVIVASLSTGQLAIELHNLRKPHSFSRHVLFLYLSGDILSRPLLSTRPRSRSKPDDIFIHPAQSNIARADAVALELGLAGETERVQGNFVAQGNSAWEVGKGRGLAREMLLGCTKPPSLQGFKDPTDSDSDPDSD